VPAPGSGSALNHGEQGNPLTAASQTRRQFSDPGDRDGQAAGSRAPLAMVPPTCRRNPGQPDREHGEEDRTADDGPAISGPLG